MDVFEITPLATPFSKAIEIPGSKSYTNRALVMAALTKGAVTLVNPLFSNDTEAMIGCLRALGLRIETSTDKIIVHDDISIVQDNFYELNAQDSGTTLRFLLAMACLTRGTKVIQGSARLNERPIKDLVEALRQLGAKIEHPPLKIYPAPLKGDVSVNASLSSQFVSALLMIAPLLDGLNVRLQGDVASLPYIEMTIHMMREWGVEVIPMEGGYHIPPRQSYRKKEYVIEGDFSSAGYFFAIAALTQSTLKLKNLNPLSVQADRKFLEILERMGNAVHLSAEGITFKGKQVLPSLLDMKDCPDQVQTMAVLAAFAKGITTITGVRTLRLKETERIKALKNELAKMGIKTEDTHDTLTIYGGDPRPASIETYDDHRMAMAFAVAGTKIHGMKIRSPEVVNKTFPAFWDTLRSL